MQIIANTHEVKCIQGSDPFPEEYRIQLCMGPKYKLDYVFEIAPDRPPAALQADLPFKAVSFHFSTYSTYFQTLHASLGILLMR